MRGTAPRAGHFLCPAKESNQRKSARLPRPAGVKAWEGFVENTVGFGRTQGQTMTVGVLPLAVAQAAAGFSPVLHVPDRLIVGRKAQRHATHHDGLPTEQWSVLPTKLVGAKWFMDTRSGDLIGLISQGEMTLKIAVDRSGMIDTVYSVSQKAVQGDIKGGSLKEVR
jgi:hypothetical protein